MNAMMFEVEFSGRLMLGGVIVCVKWWEGENEIRGVAGDEGDSDGGGGRGWGITIAMDLMVETVMVVYIQVGKK